MRDIRCLTISLAAAGVGVIIPLLWILCYWMLGNFFPQAYYYLMIEVSFERFLLVLWPAMILMLGDPLDSSHGLLVLAVLANALIYGGITLVICFARRRLLS